MSISPAEMRPLDDRESQGLGGEFRNGFRWWDRSRVGAGGRQIALCGVGFSGVVVRWRDSGAFWARDVDAAGDGVLACGWLGR